MASENKQLTINMIASVASYIVTYSISFFLTPYIIKTLGIAAYGFVGLTNTIIGYSSLMTIALNSMASRFIAIEYHKGDFDKARRYLSAVFFGNCLISAILLIVSSVLCIFLEYIIVIPTELIGDVKLLFLLLSVTSISGLLSNIYNVAPFIKNRLDYSNVRNIIGSMLSSVVVVLLFTLLAPKVWYFGLTSILSTVYVFVSNFFFTRKFTPELRVKKSLYAFKYVLDLLKAGGWNLITKMSVLLETGFNLLIANLFVGPAIAGVYALCTTVPLMINSVCAVLSNNFAPNWTTLYAKNDDDSLLHEIKKSIRIMGFLSSIPIAIFVVCGKTFFHLWVPTQDATLLYWLALAGSVVMVVAMPLEPLWQIFTITNKVKKTSINLLEWSIAMFVCVIIGMYITEDTIVRIFIIASVKSLLGTIRTLTFLPIYGAKCLGLKRDFFYKDIWRNLICSGLIILLCWPIGHFVMPKTWLGLVLGALLTLFVGITINWRLTLYKSDRVFVTNKMYALTMRKNRR